MFCSSLQEHISTTYNFEYLITFTICNIEIKGLQYPKWETFHEKFFVNF